MGVHFLYSERVTLLTEPVPFVEKEVGAIDNPMIGCQKIGQLVVLKDTGFNCDIDSI